MQEASPAFSFPSLEGILDGMVSLERNPENLEELEREWAKEYIVAAGAAAAGDPLRLKALAQFANYHTNLLTTLGLSETAMSKFLKDKHGELKENHSAFLEA
jgi:hypothetical protein